jgi:hypothetical protein
MTVQADGTPPLLDHGVPFFDGVGVLLRLVHSLASRRGRQAMRPPLPILWLIRPTDGPAWLEGLRTRLHASEEEGEIPHALVDCGRAPLEVRETSLLPVLHRLYEELHGQDLGPGPVHFRNYELAHWLTQQTPLAGLPDQRARELMRAWRRTGAEGIGHQLTEGLPALVRLPWVLAVVFGPALRFRVWTSGRLPGFGQPRWFLAQRSRLGAAGMYNAASFVSLAERMTSSGDPQTARGRDVRWLLAAAFLQDLRMAYRRVPWRVRPWRRSANVVALLENADPAAAELVELLSKVRARVSDVDPLLAVLAGAEAPADVDPASVLTAANADDGYDQWRAALDNDHWRAALERDRRRVALGAAEERFTGRSVLPLRIPAATVPPDASAGPAATGAWRRMPAPSWPLLARRRVLVPVFVALVVLAGFLVRPTAQTLLSGCHAWNQPGVSVSRASDGECVGYSAGPFTFTTKSKIAAVNDQQVKVQKAIFAENACARAVAKNDGRKLISIVYYAGLTTPSSAKTDWAAAQVDELEGLLTWQRVENAPSSPADQTACAGTELASSADSFALQIIIANGGDEMRYADVVTTDKLIPLVRHGGDTIVGVVGFDRTNPQTESSIATLGRDGIPAVGTTISGDGIAVNSPFYLQIDPSNTREALLVAYYAQSRGYKEINIYANAPTAGCDPNSDLANQPDVSDPYEYTLAQDVQADAALVSDQDGTRRVGATIRGCPTSAEVRSDCAPGNLYFYGGRQDAFNDFMDELHRDCPGAVSAAAGSSGPGLVADDSVTRYLVEFPRGYGTLSGANLTFDYVSKDPAAPLAGKSCLTGLPASAGTAVANRAATSNVRDPATIAARTASSTSALQTFCASVTKMFDAYSPPRPGGFGKPQIGWADERTALTYDAAGLLINAVREGHDPAHPSTLVAAIRKEYTRTNPYPGVTGGITFDAGQSGDGNALAILHYNQRSQTATCTYMISGDWPVPAACDTP